MVDRFTFLFATWLSNTDIEDFTFYYYFLRTRYIADLMFVNVVTFTELTIINLSSFCYVFNRGN